MAGHALAACLAMLALLAGRGALAETVVSVTVDMRAEIAAGRFDPARHGVGMRGALAPLSWQRSLLARPVGDGRYTLELRFARIPFGGQAAPYKFRIEREGQGGDEGWEQGPNRLLTFDTAAPVIDRAFDAPPQPVAPRRTGRIERLGRVASAHVAAREVQVWLPPGYADGGTRRYPVLYLHDGQNVFDAQAAGAEWMVDETAQRLAEAGEIDPPIIVAVDHGPDRLLDYTPTRAVLGAERLGQGPTRAVGGGAPAYGRFLFDELKPLIDARYRTRPEAEATAVGGSSLGGLVSLWLALQPERRIGAALVVSPSLWWDDRWATREASRERPAAANRTRLWLDIGAHEGDEGVAELQRLAAALRAQGWSDATLASTLDPEGHHDEVSWASRVEAMLRFLYGRRPPSR